MQSHAFFFFFCRINDNTLYRKPKTLEYCLYRDLCLQVITKAAFSLCACTFACIFRMHWLVRNERMKATERERTDREEMGKCRLFVLVHIAQFTSKASISHGPPQPWETKVICVEEKRERAYRTERPSSTGFSVCRRIAFTAAWREVLVMYCSFFISCCWQMIILYIYMWLMCFNISSFCLAFFPLLRVLGLKKAALTRWKNVPRWCRGSRKKEIKRRNHGSMCEEERYVGHSRCG